MAVERKGVRRVCEESLLAQSCANGMRDLDGRGRHFRTRMFLSRDVVSSSFQPIPTLSTTASSLKFKEMKGLHYWYISHHHWNTYSLVPLADSNSIPEGLLRLELSDTPINDMPKPNFSFTIDREPDGMRTRVNTKIQKSEHIFIIRLHEVS